jgi:4-hydroxybenzoate polyprenyltransferase
MALPPAFAILLPMAMLAGAGLAIANARADLDTDRRSGTTSIATALGARRSWIADTVLTSAAIAIGVVFIGRVAWTALPYVAVLIGIAIVGAAIGLGSSSEARHRRAAWHLQAIGVAVAGIAWVAGVLVPN